VNDPTARIYASAIEYGRLGLAGSALWSAHDGHCACGRPNCQSPGKHPVREFTPHGLKDATTASDVIRSWVNNRRLVNIGIRTGPESGIWVLDVDPRDGGDVSLRKLGPLPETATVRTGGGGRHFFFQYPSGVVVHNHNTGKLGSGLDVRAKMGA